MVNMCACASFTAMFVDGQKSRDACDNCVL